MTKEPYLFGSLLTGRVVLELEKFDDMTTELSRGTKVFNRDDLKKVGHLGQGCYSSVDLMLSPAGAQLALKRLDRKRIRTPDEFAQAASDLANESSLLAKLDHRNIIGLVGVSNLLLSQAWEDDHGYFMVTNVLQDTLKDRLKRWRRSKQKSLDLLPHFRKQFKKDEEALLGRIETTALGIARGMEYLHDNNIVIQDLKPGNIGFDENGEIKLFDFGMAFEEEDNRDEQETQMRCGTPRYMAPEIWLGSQASKSSDVFSFGIVLYEICCLKIPFSKGKSIEYLKKRIVSGKRPSLKRIASEETRALISDCWSQNPNDRPSFYNVRLRLEHIITGSDDWEKPGKQMTVKTLSSPSLASMDHWSDPTIFDDTGYFSD